MFIGCIFIPGLWVPREKYSKERRGSGYSCIAGERTGDVTKPLTHTYRAILILGEIHCA